LFIRNHGLISLYWRNQCNRVVIGCKAAVQIYSFSFCINPSLSGKYSLEVNDMETLWKENGTFQRGGTERGKSLWIQEQFREVRLPKPKLQKEITTEVAVIGAGLAGVLTAYLLQENGISVAVLECNEAGSGMTKNTTAKITSQHGLIYHKLLMYKGEERARDYARANQFAIEKYEEIIRSLQIDCDFERTSNYIYARENAMRVRQEAEAVRRLRLPGTFTRETALPFPVKAAVRFDNQAQFHPLRFLDVIANKLTIYENTRVTEVLSDGTILTDEGKVHAKSIVIATHYPFINVPGYYFLKMHQERYYLSAIENCDSLKYGRLDGMYLDADPQGYSLRNYKNYLLFGCTNHRSGDYKPKDAYTKLEAGVKRWYPEAKIKYFWSNQDCMTPDSIPYIGKYSVNTPNIYVATGFNQWGMSSSMVSAMIISDMILGRRNDYHKVFTPTRLMFSGSKKMLKDTGIITNSLLSEFMKVPHDKLDDIGVGEAGVINRNGQKYGVYRESFDKYYFISTKCPHLGCSLEWNPNELTWDCPCHGSRFDYRGRLISNPAMRDAFDACCRRRV
jgi:glycine/D-amino acid oxidase-like deaminating enzyme/nitrite reductase/ring-hydroxylating ferredoxin subunit